MTIFNNLFKQKLSCVGILLCLVSLFAYSYEEDDSQGSNPNPPNPKPTCKVDIVFNGLNTPYSTVEEKDGGPPHETKPFGGIICFNNNDNAKPAGAPEPPDKEGNDKQDVDDINLEKADPDILSYSVTITVDSATNITGTITPSFEGDIKLWQDTTKKNLSPQQTYKYPSEYEKFQREWKYVEGIKGGGKGKITVKFKIDGGGECDDTVNIQVVEVDMDVDSDNKDEEKWIATPAKPEVVSNGSEDRDAIEMDSSAPGKYLRVSSRDFDSDGSKTPDMIPDFADFKIDDHAVYKIKKHFIPVVIHLPTITDSDKMKLKFGYAASDPTELIEQGEKGSKINPKKYRLPESGKMRIWTKDAFEDRSDLDKTFVKNGKQYTPEELNADGHQITLYIEAVKEIDKDDLDSKLITLELEANDAGKGVVFKCTDSVFVATICTEKAGDSGADIVGQSNPVNFSDSNTANIQYATGGGNLLLKLDSLTGEINSPAAFKFEKIDHANTTVTYENGAVKEIISKGYITTVSTIDAYSYKFSTRKKEQAEGNETNSITIQNPDANDSPERLRITTNNNGSVKIQELLRNEPENAWVVASIDQGSGLALRKESQTLEKIAGDDVVTKMILDGEDNILFKTETTYHDFAFGRRIIKEVRGDLLTSTISYHEDESDLNNYGKVKRRTHEDGSWKEYTYLFNSTLLTFSSDGAFTKNEFDSSGRVVKKIESYRGSAYSNNETEHKVTTFGYNSVIPGDNGSERVDAYRVKSVTILGHPITKSYYGYLPGETVKILAATPTSTVDDINNLVSRTYFYIDGEFQGQTYKEISFDGTGTLTTFGPQGTTVESGAFNNTGDNIVAGTRTITVLVDDLLQSTVTEDIASGLVISSSTVVSRDSRGRVTRIEFSDGTFEENIYDDSHLVKNINREGLETEYFYNDQNQLVSTISNGIESKNFYHADGKIWKKQIVGKNGTVRTVSETFYDISGRLAERKDHLGNSTFFSETYNGGNRTQTTIYPNGGTSVVTTDSKGTLLSRSGTAEYPFEGIYEEGVVLDDILEYYVEYTKVGNNENSWVLSYKDALGRVYKSVTSSGAVSLNTYNNLGQIIKTTRPDSASQLFEYDNLGRQTIVAVDINDNGMIDYDGYDQLTESRTDFIASNNENIYRTRTWQWQTSNEDIKTLILTNKKGLTTNTIWRETPQGINVTEMSLAYTDGKMLKTLTETSAGGAKKVSVRVLSIFPSV